MRMSRAGESDIRKGQLNDAKKLVLVKVLHTLIWVFFNVVIFTCCMRCW